MENIESSVDYQNVPSTSKFLSMTHENDLFNKSNEDLTCLNKSRENNLFLSVSSSRESDISDGSFSENSVDCLNEESLSHGSSDSSTTGL